MGEKIEVGGNRLTRNYVVYLSGPLPTTMLRPIVASRDLIWLRGAAVLRALGCIIGMSGSTRRVYGIVQEASTASDTDHG